jgi:hypothetical protein
MAGDSSLPHKPAQLTRATERERVLLAAQRMLTCLSSAPGDLALYSPEQRESFPQRQAALRSNQQLCEICSYIQQYSSQISI